jgi:hypothetical protein
MLYYRGISFTRRYLYNSDSTLSLPAIDIRAMHLGLGDGNANCPPIMEEDCTIPIVD